MNLKKIQIMKSKTIGTTNAIGKTQFKKIQIMAEATLDENDNKDKVYEELSGYIENKFQYEKNVK